MATKTKSSSNTDQKYYEAVGRRKSATARVRLFESDKAEFMVNNLPANEYFKTEVAQGRIRQPLEVTEMLGKFRASVKVSGSGLSSQADAIALAVARALLEYDEELRSQLRTADLLKRDPRIKERKKPGLRKARKRPQWSKR
jgi:small subunit ribosomal protein S9